MAAHTQAYKHAKDIPEVVWSAFKRNEGAANIMLPFALNALEFPPENEGQLWIAYFDATGQVTFVLSCTSRSLGDYPIFIFTTLGPAERQVADITGPLDSVARALARALDESRTDRARVFSVFACEAVTREFCKIWSMLSGIKIEREYYHATFTFCTSATLTPSSNLRTLPEDRNLAISLGPAESSHLALVARLCEEFSKTSVSNVKNR